MKTHLLCVGGEDHFLRIPFLLALRHRGFQVTAAGTGDPAPFTQAGLDYCRFHFDRFLNPLADWAAFRTLSKLILDLRPGIVQCFDTKPTLLLGLLARSTADMTVVSTINGLGWIYSSHSPMAYALRPVFCALYRMASTSTAVSVFQNRFDQAFFTRRRMVGKQGNLVIPGSGIDVDGFERAAAAGPTPAEVRTALGVGTSKLVITITRMTRQKGVPTLLKAAALVHAVRPDVRFLLVGPRKNEGPLAVTQAEIDRHAPYVTALGWRSDVPALLRAADVFAFPTELREGVPRALLEAAIAGCPIVTTDMPGCNDVIRDGWNGLLVPPGSAQCLSERILRLLRDPGSAKSLANRAAALVRKDFSLKLTVDRYVAVYDRLLNGCSLEQAIGQ